MLDQGVIMLCKGLLYEILYYYILKSRRNSIVCVSCRRAVAGLGARRTVREASSHVGTRLLLPVLITTHSCPHISLSHTQFTVPCLVQIKKTRMNGGLGPEQKAAAARRRLAPLAPQNAAGRAQPSSGWGGSRFRQAITPAPQRASSSSSSQRQLHPGRLGAGDVAVHQEEHVPVGDDCDCYVVVVCWRGQGLLYGGVSGVASACV